MEAFQPSAVVIADSISPFGHRLTSTLATIHRWVLAELNTHRRFSRSSGSSRAIPASKTLQRIADTPVLPLVWAGERRGMQGDVPIPDDDQDKATEIWLGARDAAVTAAEALMQLGVHKSITNRLLEPYMAHTVLITSVEWANFYDQRCSPLAQPEMEAAANAIRKANTASTPKPVKEGEWHLPFITDGERDQPLELLVKISAARCARTSYNNHWGERNQRDDLDLYARLRHAKPPHWSPMEHVATPDVIHTLGNLPGWRQLRHYKVMQ